MALQWRASKSTTQAGQHLPRLLHGWVWRNGFPTRQERSLSSSGPQWRVRCEASLTLLGSGYASTSSIMSVRVEDDVIHMSRLSLPYSTHVLMFSRQRTGHTRRARSQAAVSTGAFCKTVGNAFRFRLIDRCSSPWFGHSDKCNVRSMILSEGDSTRFTVAYTPRHRL